MSARRSASRGYTLIEVMAALGVLAIGATGVLAFQKSTLISNTNARNLTIANAIAMTWAERLRVDALQWNSADDGDSSDLGTDTSWIPAASTVRSAPASITGLGAPGADVMGTDIFEGDGSATAFCTHLRFHRFTDQTRSDATTTTLLGIVRVEIRVAWERNGNPIDCTTDPATIDSRPDRYGAVYLTTSVLRNTSPH